jgi:hypothetical protein
LKIQPFLDPTSQKTHVFLYKILVCILLIALIAPLAYTKYALANPGLLMWSTVDTPSAVNNIIVSPSEINSIAIGSDGHTFYAVDIPDTNGSGSQGRLYKSTDGGVTWPQDLSAHLLSAGAFMPVWNIAIAPDNPDFIAAVTDGTGGSPSSGPAKVYVSVDGGATWQVTNFPALSAGEYISCVDISVTYEGTKHDIAVGTRAGVILPPIGRVYTMTSSGFAAWANQSLPPSDVVALKFSPTYPSDAGLVVVSSDDNGTSLHLGAHDTAANTTAWDTVVGFPVALWDPAFAPPNISPNAAQIIGADIELPSDFSAQDSAVRRFYVSTDAADPFSTQIGVYRIDDSVIHRINPATSARISSIAYFGTYAEGSLLAGEVTTDPTIGLVNVWRTISAMAGTLCWFKSDTYKAPTGGGNTGYANAQLAWNPDGTMAYCGTSSADLSVGGTSIILPGSWPLALTTSGPLDESAFSVSPYSSSYGALLTSYNKGEDTDIGNIWNQLSLIDTEMDHLTDVAPLYAVVTGEGGVTPDYDIVYLFSACDNATIVTRFNSLWRSTSDPLGRTWERVLCIASNSLTTILRVKQTAYDDKDRSQGIVFADTGTDLVGHSANEGQVWDIRNLTNVTDLALSTDNEIFILNDTIVYQYQRQLGSWVLINKVQIPLDAGYSIAVPLKNPSRTGGGLADMVLVGESGPPFGSGRIAYGDFSEGVVSGGPIPELQIPPPVEGDAHVIFDDRFNENGIIYNATRDPTDSDGKIYRWTIGQSTSWDELEPPNAAFFGLVQRNDILYGAWRTPEVPEILVNQAGVDRTLYPRALVPPPPDWDYLVAELPIGVNFTREPSSLKITSNGFNSLWAIDNYPYDFANKVGLLWEYTDNAAKVGPFTTAPPSGSDIPVDPKTGRAEEVNFAWRSLSYSTRYELQIAKDDTFHNRVFVNDNITPVDQLSPSVYLPAGALIPVSGSNIGGWANLESGHTYYWRVRARGAITGEQIRSPWSATMYFTVEAGLPTASPYPTVTLFNPTYGSINVTTSPGFSWSAMPKTTKYEFILAKDAALQQIIVKAEVSTTSYLYDGKLDYGTTYFWQVRAIEPVVSDPSPIGTFTVMAEPAPQTSEVETPAPVPTWVWWIIAVITALIAAMIAFAMVKPGYGRPASGGKLFKVESESDKSTESILDKPKNPFTKAWDSIVIAIKRQRFFRKRKDKETTDSQDSLT